MYLEGDSRRKCGQGRQKGRRLQKWQQVMGEDPCAGRRCGCGARATHQWVGTLYLTFRLLCPWSLAAAPAWAELTSTRRAGMGGLPRPAGSELFFLSSPTPVPIPAGIQPLRPRLCQQLVFNNLCTAGTQVSWQSRGLVVAPGAVGVG